MMLFNYLHKQSLSLVRRVKNIIVPVSFYTLSDKDGLNLNLMTIGWDKRLRNYWLLSIGKDYETEVRTKIIRKNVIIKHIKRNQKKVDLAIIETQKLNTSSLNSFWSYTLPRWMEMVIDIESALKKSWAKETKRKIRKFSIGREFRTSRKDFDFFFYHMYKPLITSRHKGSAEIASYDILLKKFLEKKVVLLIAVRNGEAIAGQIIERTENFYRIVAFGILNGSYEIQRMGVHTALYYFALNYYLEQGQKTILCGSSMPNAFDGVTQFKMRLGAKPFLLDLAKRTKYQLISLSTGSQVFRSLKYNPLFHLHEDKLNISYFHSAESLRTKNEFLHEYKQINCENIEKIYMHSNQNIEHFKLWCNEEGIKNIKFFQYEK